MDAQIDMRPGGPQTDLQSMLSALDSLEGKMREAIDQQRRVIEAVNPLQQTSARNLIRYLALRREDIRSLQDELHM